MVIDPEEGRAPDSGPIIVSPEPAKFRIVQIGFHQFAGQFLEASDALKDDTRRPKPVRYSLLCKSIELSLKAFLLARRAASLKALKDRFGHNLENLLREAEAHGLSQHVTISDAERAAIRKATTYYDKLKVFDYFDTFISLKGYEDAPEIAALETVARALYLGVEKPCLDASDIE